MSGIAVTALVPMKGCSERVPNKNIRKFGDRPLCQHIIKTLLAVPQLDKVVVNTDSEAIADLVSLDSRVCVQFRKQELCGNSVPMNAIIADIIASEDNEHFLQTHCTNPLVTALTFSRAIEMYLASRGQYDSLFSVSEVQQRAYSANLEPLNHDMHKLINTQYLAPILIDNSCIYIFSKSSFRLYAHRLGNSPLPWPIPALEALDIDTEADFIIAEMMYKAGIHA